MDKGIRQGVNNKFRELLAQREAMGNKAFRKHILYWAVEQYGVSIASAATAYNNAFKDAKKEIPEQVVGLGRPEGKNNGGRKKKVVVEAAPAADGTPAELTGKEVEGAAEPEQAPEQTVFTVKRKKDGSVVAEGLSFEEATALVNKAAEAKKAKLYWV